MVFLSCLFLSQILWVRSSRVVIANAKVATVLGFDYCILQHIGV
jgi:hypothetical protein